MSRIQQDIDKSQTVQTTMTRPTSASTVCLTLAGVRIRLHTDYQAYAAFLQRYFAPVVCPSLEAVDIEIEARWLLDPWRRQRLATSIDAANGYSHMGSNTFVAPQKFIKYEKFGRRTFRFEGQLVDERLRMQVTCHNKGWRQHRERMDETLMANFTYYFLYYPLFWYLEKFRSIHVLHAASVQWHDSTWFIFGLDGSGKTWLTLGMLGQQGTRVISDNLVLYGRDRVYSTLQPLKVRHEHDDLIPHQKLMRCMEQRLRTYYTPRDQVLEESLHRGVILLPEFSEHAFLEPVDRETSVIWIERMNGLPFELETYDHFTRLFDLLQLTPSITQQRRQAIEALVDRCTVYRLGVGRGEALPDVVRRVTEEIGQP